MTRISCMDGEFAEETLPDDEELPFYELIPRGVAAASKWGIAHFGSLLLDLPQTRK